MINLLHIFAVSEIGQHTKNQKKLNNTFMNVFEKHKIMSIYLLISRLVYLYDTDFHSCEV